MTRGLHQRKRAVASTSGLIERAARVYLSRKSMASQSKPSHHSNVDAPLLLPPPLLLPLILYYAINDAVLPNPDLLLLWAALVTFLLFTTLQALTIYLWLLDTANEMNLALFPFLYSVSFNQWALFSQTSLLDLTCEFSSIQWQAFIFGSARDSFSLLQASIYNNNNRFSSTDNHRESRKSTWVLETAAEHEDFHVEKLLLLLSELTGEPASRSYLVEWSSIIHYDDHSLV